MALEQMSETAKRIFESLAHWVIAGVIAAGIAWVMVSSHLNERKPCAERSCFIQLDRRLAAIEADMKARTQDRYTGTDAKRDLLIINHRLDRIQAQIREKHK